MPISGIYKIINKTNGRYYVGSSYNIYGNKGRWKSHIYDLEKKKHQNSQLQYAWNKHGPNDFDWIIVENTPRENLLIVEQKYLDIAKNEKEKCYNTQFIAGKVEMTPEVRKKLSVACKGRKLTMEHKQKIAQALKGRVNRPAGWHHTKEAKAKISKNGFRWTGKTLSPQHVQKLSISHLGIKPSEETRRKMSSSQMGRKAWNKGIPMSKEAKRKLSIALSGNNNPNWKGGK